MHSSSLISLEM